MPASITSTKLTVALDADDRTIRVDAATGFVVGYGLYVDREYMSVVSITGTTISVRRGAGGTRATPHVCGARVFVAPPQYFTTYDRAGAGTYASQDVSPYINIMNGNVWSIIGGIWKLGNTYGVTADYGLSPFWSDCPLAQMRVDPGIGHFDGDDFMSGPAVTAHRYALAGANGTFTLKAAVTGGVGVITAPGTAQDEAYLTTAVPIIKCDAVSTWWFEARIKLQQVAAAQGAFCGLTGEGEVGVDFMTDTTMAMKVIDTIGWQVVQPGAAASIFEPIVQLTGGARASLAATEILGAATPVIATFLKLGMKSVAGTVSFYINGVPSLATCLSSRANFPLDQFMNVTFGIKRLAATSTYMEIDWWKAAQTRLAN